MPKFPPVVVRKTKHKQPKYQLYQPGFNEKSSFWLPGKWMTVPQDVWETKRDAHKEAYGNLNPDNMSKPAMHGGKHTPTAPKDMTPFQKQAWEFYSGTAELYGRDTDGEIQSIAITVAAGKIHPESLEGIRKKKWKVIPKVERGGERDQVALYGIPTNVLTDDTEIVDITANAVEQNLKATTEMFDGLIDAINGKCNVDGPGLQPGPDFSIPLAITLLLEVETLIIQDAFYTFRTGKQIPYLDQASEKDRYADYRRKLQDALEVTFEEHYQSAKTNHNEHQRRNLERSGGKQGYVLPVFHEDGTYEPWGDKDVPDPTYDPWATVTSTP